MKFLLLSLLLFAICCLAVSAQSLPENQEKQVDPFVREHNERRAKNPEGLLFTVRLKDNRKQFHLGELIPIELSFAAAKRETFTLDAATYDRSGRLHSDGFAIDQRENAVDPLADYFNSNLHPFMAGGLRSIPELTDKPHVMTVELNEWQRIDKPGHYRLYVVSSRVGRKGGGGTFLDNGGSPVISNVIEFDVLPADKKWAGQKLNEAIAALAKPGDGHDAACRTLRFLGTTAAATEMRKRFRGDDNRCEWDYKFGLIGSPHRDHVIRDMENAISLREQPITSHFISTLALLEWTSRVAAAPPYPPGNEEQISQWQIEMQRRRSIYDELCLHYVRQLVIAIPQKQGQARATSLQTLLDFRSQLNASNTSQWSTLLALLPDVFKQLPLENQLQVLEYQWKPIASAAMLPILREVFNYSYPPNSDRPEVSFHSFKQEELRSIALRRIYELAPEEGRRLILEEIRRPKPRVTEQLLRSLPDETLPDLNGVLLSNFEEARQNGSLQAGEIGELIERYATDEILPRMQALYETRKAGKWECRTQAALLAYFLRVAPSAGGEYLKSAVAARGEGLSRCYKDNLTSVAKLHMSPELEAVAIAALDDEDAGVVSHAAGVLAEFGSADAEKALWRRLEKWNEVNRSKQPDERLGHNEEAIESALRKALTGGHAWLSDPKKLERVRDLCLSKTRRDEVDEMIRRWDYVVYIEFNVFGDDSIIARVANSELKSIDSLKSKLLQFPKGTEFTFRTRGDDLKSQEVFQQLTTFLKEHGMSLKREL